MAFQNVVRQTIAELCMILQPDPLEKYLQSVPAHARIRIVLNHLYNADQVRECGCVIFSTPQSIPLGQTCAFSKSAKYAHVMAAAGVPVDVSTYNCVIAACRVPPTRVVPVSFHALSAVILASVGCPRCCCIWHSRQTLCVKACLNGSSLLVFVCASLKSSHVVCAHLHVCVCMTV